MPHDTIDLAHPVTDRLATFASGLTLDAVPEDAREVARHCLLDWLGVTLAGSSEPAVTMLVDLAESEGLGTGASLLSTGRTVSAGQATLINGTAVHALDYDDVLAAHRGHPSVVAIPGSLAVAERDRRSGADMLTAIVAGIETGARIGILAGDAHYARGFHATGTVGTFTGAASAGRLLGLDEVEMVMALGLAGAQASGLKANFGTMAKPLHAGKAAANGLLAAGLAARGFTASSTVLDDPQGFPAVATDRANAAEALDGLGEHFRMTAVHFKYHAACYGTHAGLECARKVRTDPGFDTTAVEAVLLDVPERTMAMCNQPAPTTGLGVKFSHRMTAAFGLAGMDTGAIDSYADALAARPDLVTLRDKVAVNARADFDRLQAAMTVRLADGREIAVEHDMDDWSLDVPSQWERLVAKFRGLATPVVGPDRTNEIVAAVSVIERLDDAGELARLCRRG